MSEVIADLDTTVTSPAGHEYYVQVVGEQLPTRRWESWLEFVPLDEGMDVLLTNTETTQATRDDLVRWAMTLAPPYIQGAFARAIRVMTGRRLVRKYDATVGDVVAPLDPFHVSQLGKPELRMGLRRLTRAELLAVIQGYDLNPAGKSLTWLSDSQLVTFIVTAVEVQTLQGRR